MQQCDNKTTVNIEMQCNSHLVSILFVYTVYQRFDLCHQGGILLSCYTFLRDQSLITGRGGLQNGKIVVQNLLRPLPFEQWKPFTPPFSIAKTLSSHVKTTSKLCVTPPPPLTPFSMAETFHHPPPFFFPVL